MRRKTFFHKPLILVGAVFLFIGVGGLLFPYLPFGLSSDLDYLDEIAEARVAIRSPFPTDSVSPAPSYDPAAPVIKNRLFIPRLGINMPIFASANANVLNRGGWIFPGTSTPERGSNTVVFGHRFRYLPPISNTFYLLDKIRIGDEIIVYWGGVKYRYSVSSSKIIDPTDFSVLDSTPSSTITLVTCAPLFSTTYRLVVVAELI